MKKDTSLDKWLFGVITIGTAIMCIVIIGASMVLYMRSVRRIYRAEMIQNASAAEDLIGDDRLIKLCKEKKNGQDIDTQELSGISEVFRKICDDDAISDMALFSFDVNTKSGKLIINAYPETEIAEEQISFTDAQLNIISQLTAGMQIRNNPGEERKNRAYYGIRDDSNEVVGLIQVTIPAHETMNARLRFLLIYTPFCTVLIIFFAIIASRAIKKRIVIPLSELNRSAVEYSSHEAGELAETDEVFFVLPKDLSNDEIGSLWKTCSKMEKNLNESIRNLKEVTAEEEKQAAEVNVASQIQLGMLPKDDPEILSRTDFSLAGSMTPAKGVGGDFYDYFFIDSDHLAMVIGDVSGKGIPAALFMMMSMTQIRNKSAGRYSPAEIIGAANETICGSNPELMFVTVWMGIVELSTGKIVECNAGHEYPAVYTSGKGYVLDSGDNDIPVGFMKNAEFTDRTRMLGIGDRLFVYTDGVPEAINESEEQFGTARMIEALNRNCELSDEKLMEKIRDEVFAFAGKKPQFDDLTALSFTLTGAPHM